MMTDRVQQMLDVVKGNMASSGKRPRLRRTKAALQAEVREGLLKHPYLPSGAPPHARGLQETQTGFSGPRHPDVWRDKPVQSAGASGRSDPAAPYDHADPVDAALAAFKATKRSTRGGRAKQPQAQGLSFDRPRMDERPSVHGGTGRTGDSGFDDPGSSQDGSNSTSGWFARLLGR